MSLVIRPAARPPIPHLTPKWLATSLVYHVFRNANTASLDPVPIIASESIAMAAMGLFHYAHQIPSLQHPKILTITSLTQAITNLTPITLEHSFGEPLMTMVLLFAKKSLEFLPIIPLFVLSPTAFPIALTNYIKAICWYNLLKKYTPEQIVLITTVGTALVLAPTLLLKKLSLSWERWIFLLVSSMAGYLHLIYSVELFTRLTPEYFTMINSMKGCVFIFLAYIFFMLGSVVVPLP